MSSFKDLAVGASQCFSSLVGGEKHTLTLKAIPLHMTRCLYFSSIGKAKEGVVDSKTHEMNVTLIKIIDYIKNDLEKWVIGWSFEDKLCKESIEEFQDKHDDFCDAIFYNYAEYCVSRYVNLTNSVEEVKKN